MHLTKVRERSNYEQRQNSSRTGQLRYVSVQLCSAFFFFSLGPHLIATFADGNTRFDSGLSMSVNQCLCPQPARIYESKLSQSHVMQCLG